LFNTNKLTVDQLTSFTYEQLREMESKEHRYEFLETEVERLERMNEDHRKVNGGLRVELKNKGVNMGKHQKCFAWINMGATLGICSGVWITLAYLVFGS